MTPLRFLAPAALLLCFACASTEAPAPEPDISEDPRIASLQQAIDEALPRERRALRRYLVTVSTVRETAGQLQFDIEVQRPEGFDRAAKDFAIIVNCPPDRMSKCADDALQAIRGAATID